MNGSKCWVMLIVAGLIVCSGCKGAGGGRVVRSSEPPLNDPLGADPGAEVAVAEVSPPGSPTFVDRHPLFSKPRDQYNRSLSSNKLAKSARATFIGVPSGIAGEVRQIFVGTPPQARGF